MDLGKIAVFVVVGITAAEAILLVPNMFSHELYPDYNDNILPFVFSCKLDQAPEINDSITRNPLKYWLHCASFTLTGYPNSLLVPFAIGILPIVYYLGYYITDDKRVGMIAITAMAINPYYSSWANSGTYDQVWAFFVLLSVVLLYKHQGKGVLSYVISILGKTMSLTYFPMWLYSIWHIKKDMDVIIIISLIAALGVSLSLYYGIAQQMIGSPIGFYSENLIEAATSLISSFWMILPLLIGMIVWNNMFKAKDQIKNKKMVLVWILGVFVMTVLTHLFTQQQTYGYRYVPLAAFMSVYLGQVIVDTRTYLREEKLKETAYKS